MKTILSLFLGLWMGISLTAQPVNLQYQLEQNKTYRLQLVNDQSITMTIQGTEQTFNNKSIQVISMKLTGMENNNLLVDVRFDSISNSSNAGGMDIQINSANVGRVSARNPSDLMSFFYHRFSQCTLHVKMSNAGEILDITNYKLITDSILSFTDSITGQMAKPIQNQLNTSFDLSSLKSQLSALTHNLPGKAITVGSKYETSMDFSSNGVKLKTTVDYKFKKLTNNVATLSGESTIEPISMDPVENMGMQMIFDIRGLGSNDVELDTNTGLILKSNGKIHLQGTINIVSNSMQIPMEINGTNTITQL